MENTELLSKLNIPEEQHKFYFVKDQIVYPPLVENGQIIKTGEQRYNERFNKPEEISLWKKLKRRIGLW